MENDDAWGRWYDRNEENERMAQSNLDFAHRQGVKEGIELGSKKKEREMVINLNKQGLSLDIISISSGLTITEIETIINNHDDNKKNGIIKSN